MDKAEHIRKSPKLFSRENYFFIIDKAPNNDFFLICYDPTNTYNMCLKNNTLSFSDHQLVNKDKFYQVILFHYNNNLIY